MSQRINVMISDEVNEKLNDLSKRYGMAKSSICAFVIGQWIDQKERVESVVLGDAMKNVIEDMKNNQKE